MFALTATAGDAEEIFQRMRDAVKIITDTYGTNKLRYSVIVYGTLSKTIFDFQPYFSTREGLKYVIERIQKMPGRPDTKAALEEALRVIKDSGTRPTAKTVVVLISDGAVPVNPQEVEKSIEAIEKGGIPVVEFIVPDNAEAKEVADKVMEKVLAGRSLNLVLSVALLTIILCPCCCINYDALHLSLCIAW